MGRGIRNRPTPARTRDTGSSRRGRPTLDEGDDERPSVPKHRPEAGRFELLGAADEQEEVEPEPDEQEDRGVRARVGHEVQDPGSEQDPHEDRTHEGNEAQATEQLLAQLRADQQEAEDGERGNRLRDAGQERPGLPNGRGTRRPARGRSVPGSLTPGSMGRSGPAHRLIPGVVASDALRPSAQSEVANLI